MAQKKTIRVLLPVLLLLIWFPFERAFAQTALPDYITKTIEWQTESGDPQTPIHVSLLPDGRLFFFETPFTMTPTPFWQWANDDLPDAVIVEPNFPPLVNYLPGVQYGDYTVIDTIACAGHTLSEDGSILVFGGTRLFADKPVSTLTDYAAIAGFSSTLSYSPATDAWTPMADMTGPGQADIFGSGSRWYPTATRLANGKILVTSGLELVSPLQIQNRSVEVFDPAANFWEILSQHDETPPSIYNRDYSHVFQLPERIDNDFDVLMMGEYGQPVLMSTDGLQRWRPSGAIRPGNAPGDVTNHGTTTALLPLRLNGDGGYSNGSIVMAGGSHGTANEHTIDIYDPVEDAWLPRIDMGILRHHPSTVLLPDSRVLIIAGHNNSGDHPGYAQYLDPLDNFSLTKGTVEVPEVRGYHTITVLLPDGRIFLGSGNDGGQAGNEKPNFRYYYPDYMLKPRPELLFTPDTLRLGDYFWALTKDKTPISEIVLVGLGSMTHSYDMNQRVIQVPLVYSTDYGEHSVHIGQAPLTGEVAPPGHYMMFVLDDNRVPSVAKIVQVTR